MGDLPFGQYNRGIKRSRPDAINDPPGSSFIKRARLEDSQSSLFQKMTAVAGSIWSWFTGTPAIRGRSAIPGSSREITIMSQSEGTHGMRPSIYEQRVEKDHAKVVQSLKQPSTVTFLPNSSAFGRFYGGDYIIATKEKREHDKRLRSSESISRQIRQQEFITPRVVQPCSNALNPHNRINSDTIPRKFVQRVKKHPICEWQSIPAAYQKEELEKYRKICERLQGTPGPMIAREPSILSRGPTPQNGRNETARAPFSVQNTGAITQTQYLSFVPTNAYISSEVITIYDEEEQNDEEVVIVSSTEKGSAPDVLKIIERYTNLTASPIELPKASEATRSVPSMVSSGKVCRDDHLAELLAKYDTRCQVLDRRLLSEIVKRDYCHGKADRFQASVEERLRKNLTITDVIQLEDKEEDEEYLTMPPITEEMEREISKGMNTSGQIIIEQFCIPITVHDLQTLNGLNWLNDSIINFYLQMVVQRSKLNPRYPKVYAFSTYFFSKVLKTGHPSVKRWTKKEDIFGYDLLVIPIHLKIHWCLGVVDMRKKNILFYDSIPNKNPMCVNALESYLKDEHLDKKGSPLEIKGFMKINVKDIPYQQNSSDCGMFACKFAEYLSRDAKITFTQADMPYFRKRMKYEIITNTLLYP